jgi:hypothetical protein
LHHVAFGDEGTPLRPARLPGDDARNIARGDAGGARFVDVEVELGGVRSPTADEHAVQRSRAGTVAASNVQDITVRKTPAGAVRGGEVEVTSGDDDTASELDPSARPNQGNAAGRLVETSARYHGKHHAESLSVAQRELELSLSASGTDDTHRIQAAVGPDHGDGFLSGELSRLP